MQIHFCLSPQNAAGLDDDEETEECEAAAEEGSGDSDDNDDDNDNELDGDNAPYRTAARGEDNNAKLQHFIAVAAADREAAPQAAASGEEDSWCHIEICQFQYVREPVLPFQEMPFRNMPLPRKTWQESL